MSNDLINQITLSHLISKKQLEKLNKTNINNIKNQKKNIYRDRIIDLFINLLDEKEPNDIMSDVKKGFEFYVTKAIYYFELHDAYIELEKKRTSVDSDIQNTIIKENEEHFEMSDNDLKQHNNTENDDDENDDDENENDDDDNENDDEDEDEDNEDNEDHEDDNNINISNKGAHKIIYSQKHDNIVYPKYKKTFSSQGVEDINHISLDWFTRVKKENQQNRIVPRK
jgi:cobalamin biosynthesis protein CobT